MRWFPIVAALVAVLAFPGLSTARATHRAGTPTTTKVAVVPNPSVAGQTVTLTATVSPSGGAGAAPGGTVQFLINGTPVAASQPLENGQASALTATYAGTYAVRAVYSGDATFDASAGSTDMVVDRADTTTAVSSSANPASVGGALTLTIVTSTLAPGDVAPAGTVAILFNGLDVSGPVPLYEYTSTASAVEVDVPSAFLAQPGSATIAARYSGDEDTNPSVSDGFVQSVAGPLATPSPTPVPTAQPTPTAPAVATTRTALSAMTTPLTRALLRHGIGALTVTKQRLSVTAPGTLVQRVYSPAAPASATTSAAKAVLIAQGSHAFPAAGPGTLTLRLTAAGRKAVHKGKRLKIEVVTRFTASSGAVVTSSTKLTVRGGA